MKCRERPGQFGCSRRTGRQADIKALIAPAGLGAAVAVLLGGALYLGGPVYLTGVRFTTTAAGRRDPGEWAHCHLLRLGPALGP